MALPYIDTLVSSAVEAVKRSGLLESLMVSGTVSAVGTDGTVAVSRGSDTYPKVRALSGYLSPTVGDTVTIMRTLSGWVCPGKWRTDNLPSGGGTGLSVSSWTPTLTSISIGNGVVQGWRATDGAMAYYGVKIEFGSTTSVSSTIRVSTPYPPKLLPGIGVPMADAMGAWQYRVSGNENYTGTVTSYDSGGADMCMGGCWPTGSDAGVLKAPAHRIGVSSTVTGGTRAPVNANTGHVITLSGSYAVA